MRQLDFEQLEEINRKHYFQSVAGSRVSTFGARLDIYERRIGV